MLSNHTRVTWACLFMSAVDVFTVVCIVLANILWYVIKNQERFNMRHKCFTFLVNFLLRMKIDHDSLSSININADECNQICCFFHREGTNTMEHGPQILWFH